MADQKTAPPARNCHTNDVRIQNRESGDTKGICRFAHAFFTYIRWRTSHLQQFFNFCEVYIQIIIDIDFDGGVKRVGNTDEVFLKVIHSDAFSLWINNPVLPYTMILIIKQFTDIIVRRITGGNNFNNKIRSTVTAVSVQFIFVTNDQDVRLKDSVNIV